MTNHDLKYRDGDGWSSATLRMRDGDGWKTLSDRTAVGGDALDSTGVDWDQTHVDTSWWFDADANDDITVETVTSLDATGPGTLHDALERAEDNDTTLIVFEVGGILDWEGEEGNGNWLRPETDNVLVAGETAPWPGITMIRGGVRIEGDNNIWRHMTLLIGHGVPDVKSSRCWVFDDDGDNNILDHMALGWSPETNISHREDHDALAVINSINAEALNDSDHPEAPHGYGTHYSGGNSGCSYIGNLHAHNWKRNPRSKGDDMFWANTYVYNWGARHFHSGSYDPTIDWVNCVSHIGGDTESHGYFKHNYTVYMDGLHEVGGSRDLVESGDIDFVDEPMNVPDGLDPEEDLVPAEDLEEHLLPIVGPRPADRDPWSERVVTDWQNREGGIIDYEEDRGGYPDYDTTTRSLDPPSSNVGDWLQHYVNEVELGEDNPLH